MRYLDNFREISHSQNLERRLIAHIRENADLERTPARADVARATLRHLMPYLRDWISRPDLTSPKLIFGDRSRFSYDHPDSIFVSLGHSHNQVKEVIHETSHYVQEEVTKHGKYTTDASLDRMPYIGLRRGQKPNADDAAILISSALNEACAQFVTASILGLGSGERRSATFKFLDERDENWPSNDSVTTAYRIYQRIVEGGYADRTGKSDLLNFSEISKDPHQLGRGLAVLYYLRSSDIGSTAKNFLTTTRYQTMSEIVSNVILNRDHVKAELDKLEEESLPFLEARRRK